MVRFAGEQDVLDVVRGHLARGVPKPLVFVDLLGTAARSLGALWEADECSFTDVTIGLCRLHMVLREESSLFGMGGTVDPQRPRRRILLATGNGDQHFLGLVLVAEFFRQADWQVSCEPGLDADGIADRVARNRYDVLALSISQSSRIHSIRVQIDAFRKASLHQPIGVLVGGRLLEVEPEMAERLDADGYCADAVEAPRVAERMLERLGVRSSPPM
jgi:methanogenic corrinoid protein MtbC1